MTEDRKLLSHYKAHQTGRSSLWVTVTDTPHVEFNTNEERWNRIAHHIHPVSLDKKDRIAPLPTVYLKDTSALIAFWIPEREEWVGILFTRTDDPNTWPEDEMEIMQDYYSPGYLCDSDKLGRPTQDELDEADAKQYLVQRRWDYDDGYLSVLGPRAQYPTTD